MPRNSPFGIELTSEEREELQSRVRKYTSPYCDVIRAKIVLLAAEGSPMMSLPLVWTPLVRSLASGGSGSVGLACRASRSSLGAGVKPAFPPSLVVQVKALACELPHRFGLPLSRFSVAEIRQEVLRQGL
jgi:hypothetical protein